MKPRDRIVVTGVVSVLFLMWLGFLVHRSPRFPGSGVGAVFGIAGAVVLLFPLIYPIAKRIPFIHSRITSRIPLKTLLSLHVYTGILGPLLAIIHTGHKFTSILGIMLTGAMLLVVVSGFAGRYLLSYVNEEIKDKLVLLQTARGDLDSAWGALRRAPQEPSPLPRSPLFAAGLASIGLNGQFSGPVSEVTRTAESVSDLEFAIDTHELFKRWSSRWLTAHIALSILMYLLLALHISAGFYFGLRWLR